VVGGLRSENDTLEIFCIKRSFVGFQHLIENVLNNSLYSFFEKSFEELLKYLKLLKT
jgi:hypothetical protein